MGKNEYFDVTLPIGPGLCVWPGSSLVEFKKVKDMKLGDKSNDTEYKANAHVGTHLDAPFHFIADGKTIEQVELDKMIGEAYVAEIAGVREITAQNLENMRLPAGLKRLLVKTDNSRLWQEKREVFYEDFTAFTSSAAQWIVDRGIELVGIDYLSIQKFDAGPEVHQILLGAEVAVLEGINLAAVSEGYYELICLPIKLAGLEAAPARVLLRKREK